MTNRWRRLVASVALVLALASAGHLQAQPTSFSRLDVAEVLAAMKDATGRYWEPGVDFTAQRTGDTVIVTWLSGLPMPTEAQIDAFAVANPGAFAVAQATKTAAQVGRVSAVRKTANQARNAQTLADVTDLTFQLQGNTHYIFEFEGAYTADAATTGLRVAVNGPASPTLVRVLQEVHESATTRRSSAVGAYDTQVLGAASGGSTALPFRVKGNITTGTNGGALTLRFSSEVAASNVTILSGSWGELKAVGN